MPESSLIDLVGPTVVAVVVVPLVIIIVIVVFLIWAIRRSAPVPEDPAISELKARYARGEIETAEFQVRLRELSGE